LNNAKSRVVKIFFHRDHMLRPPNRSEESENTEKQAIIALVIRSSLPADPAETPWLQNRERFHDQSAANDAVALATVDLRPGRRAVRALGHPALQMATQLARSRAPRSQSQSAGPLVFRLEIGYGSASQTGCVRPAAQAVMPLRLSIWAMLWRTRSTILWRTELWMKFRICIKIADCNEEIESREMLNGSNFADDI
jgi:hypothetical protein